MYSVMMESDLHSPVVPQTNPSNPGGHAGGGGGKVALQERVMESVDMARQAVQMDVSDGTSWCE